MIELFKNLVALTDKKTLNMILQIYGKSKDDIISWLEKQGKIIDEYEDKLDRCACENFDRGYKAALEKQGEQKPANKVEPKFKVGDIIRHIPNELNDLRVECKITRIDDKFYYSEYDGAEVVMFGLPAQDTWELVKQKPDIPTWNEEDERMINSIIKNLDEAEWFDIYQTDWLRSLKERLKGE